MSSQFSSIEEARERIDALVQKYAQNREHYHHSSYNEETARSEFISPFFEALGWDVTNRQALAPAYKDVIHEESQRTGELGTKAPDYTFRVGGQRKFFVEAKKPFVDVKNDPAPASQLRRYAWTAKLPLSILTDFEELAVYDTRKRPDEKDKASVARVQLLGFEEYLPKLDDIWQVFSKEAVYKGSFDRYAEETLGKRGTSEVDAEFLKELERWRDELARNIALRNKERDLSVDELNFAVQATIDRILFLRIAEGRGVETYGQLQALTNGENVYPRLMHVFRKADAKYNSGIFDFKSDHLTTKLEVDDKVLRGILGNLYYPQSPYEFSVLPPEILGNVYEQFLGKVIRLTAGGSAKIEEKPEVKKAGGVYYTPTYIVDYIVMRTVGKLCEGKSPKEMAKLRIVDPACGSGSFLLVAFQTLLDAHLAWYSDNNPKKHTKEVFLAAGVEDNNWRLTTAEKRRILLKSIYGVDIDRQAVEVTKLSLLLRVLEGENAETLKQHALFGERALPSLEDNIKCGNSLIGTDAFRGSLFPDPDDLRRINPFDWQTGFAEAFKSGGFDAVIGNPPYIRIQTMKEWAPVEVELYKQLYRSAASGNYDIYVVFVEQGLRLLNRNGRLGFILPHKFFNAKYGEGLRQVISEGKHLAEVVHFEDQQVFKGATTYTCLLFLDKAEVRFARVSRVADLDRWRSAGEAEVGKVRSSRIGTAEWNFAIGAGKELFERLSGLPSKLRDTAEKIGQGIRTSANEIYVLDVISTKGTTLTAHSEQLDREVSLETGAVSQFLLGKEIKPWEIHHSGKVVLVPYEMKDQRAVLIPEAEYRERWPLAMAYLKRNKEALEEREGGRFQGAGWYGYSRPQNIELMLLPKILVPDIANGASFALDQDGRYAFTSGYGITLPGTTSVSHRSMLALLNSSLLDYYLKSISTPMRGGFFRYFTQFVEQLPIHLPDMSSRKGREVHDRLESMGARMLGLHVRRRAASTSNDRDLLSRQIEATDREIDRIVYELYELTPEEIAIVEKATDRK